MIHEILICLEQFCINGIQKDDVCCSKSCGQCGGANCQNFPGGFSKCCKGAIKNIGAVCKTDSDTACLLPGII